MKKAAGFLQIHGYRLCLALLFAAAFVLRSCRLASLPDVLELDEAAVGYNAWSLAHYGVDRYLNPLPIYPENFQGGQSPLYTYLLALLFRLFPSAAPTRAFVRFPALFFSMLCVVCTARLLSLAFEDKKITLTGTALCVFCPYFIMSGRLALDCNLMLGASILALTLLFGYLKTPTWPRLFLCGAGFALILYTYALSYLVVPAFLAALSLYLLYTRRISFLRLCALAGEIALLALPLLLFVLCLVLHLPGFRFLGLHILPIAAQRMEDLAQVSFLPAVYNCLRITLTNSFYMLDAVSPYYTMYGLSIPFIGIGFLWSAADFLRSLKKRRFTSSAVFLFFAASVAAATGLAGLGYIYRANAIFLCYLAFCAVGIRRTLEGFPRFQRFLRPALLAGYALWTAAFLRYYFTEYSVADTYTYPNSLYFVPEQAALSRIAQMPEADHIYIDCFFDEYFYFYYPVSPYERGTHLSPSGKKQCLSAVVNGQTPLESSSAYLVRKENQEFIDELLSSGLPYQTETFAYYELFLLP